MSVMDFADYRLRMRAGGPFLAKRSYYLVGLTQGVRRGVRAAATEPRKRLAGAIRSRYPTRSPTGSTLRRREGNSQGQFMADVKTS